MPPLPTRRDSPARARPWRGLAAAAALGALVVPATARQQAPAQSPDAAALYGLVEGLGSSDGARRRAAAGALIATGDPSVLAPLVDQLFFTPPRQREEILAVLRDLAGTARPARYLDWVEVVSRRDDLAPPAGYVGWKGRLFSRIDRRFGEVLRDGAPIRLRPEEVVSGGVAFDGIPPLERPRHVAAGAAHHLEPGELVFGARVGGAARAWPVRVLSWHEMLNDELGGEPVTLSYCTLCRSAILYRGRLPDGTPTTFGTSGLLYRSNKLMFDRRTRTLWSNLTGEPLLGPLAASPEPLEQLPLTTTTWSAWVRQNPDTTAMVVDEELGRRHGYDYRAGAADARRAGVSFPVPRRDARLSDREEVYGLRRGGAARAYPLPALLAAGVVEDALGTEPVVLVADPESGAVRAYAAAGGPHGFTPAGPAALRDARGRLWSVREEALVADAEGVASLPRLAGHRSFWFAWASFYPLTSVWVPASPAPPPRGDG